MPAERFADLLDLVHRYPSTRITFDDGNASDVSLALPALLERRLTADFFIVAGRLGEPGFVNAADVETLAAAGMNIGSHGMRHRSWRGLTAVERREELGKAPAVLQSIVGQPVRDVSVPYGAYDRSLLRALAAHGFRRVYTTDGGPAHPDSWLQTRYCVRSWDTTDRLEQLLADPRGSAAQAALRVAKRTVKRLR